MNNIIELKFERLEDVYSVELTGKEEGKEADIIRKAKIPAFDPNRYDRYQQACRNLYERNSRLEFVSSHVTTAADLAKIRQDLDESATNLLDTLNYWGELPEFAEIAEAIESRSQNLRVTISTECPALRQLPFHKLNLFPKDTEVIFSGVEARVFERTRHPDKIRILVILGDDRGIDIEQDKKAIKEYCKTDAEIEFLAQPDKATLKATLADPQGWDIIFFSGHSYTDEDRTGRICINAKESLTMDELEDVLAPAIALRVQIAIFNSCDGLGITPTLEKLNIERLIVMREPVPDFIAQEFLKSFLKAFTGGARFDDAVKSARQYLDSDNFKAEYPYASWLPIVIQNRLVPSLTWQGLGKIRSPYKYLEAFTEADAANFYGREETIEQLTDLVSTKVLVPILGASGSGKSSLVQAGLIPRLKQDSQQKWQILTMRPGLNPFTSLSKAFSDNRVDLETIELDIELACKPDALTKKLAQMRMPQHRILLFIDQFEELFTQSSDKPDRAEQQEITCQLFLQSLADAVSNAPHFTLVFTLRNDFLPTLQGDRAHRDFKDLLERYYPLLLGGMTRDRLRAAITKPVANLNVKFEDGLVERLSQDVGDGDGTLPLLQLVLGLLWEQQQPRLLTHAGYEAICRHKGVKAVLAERAEEIYAEFVKQDRVNQFRTVFFNLVSLGDGTMGTTRRITSFADIGESNWRDIVVPLSTSTNRLLRTDFDEKTQVATVEIIHESLIQYWQRLKNWIEEYRHELERIAEIKTAAMKWDKNNRSKQDLWQGRKLKEAKKFSKAPERVIDVGSIVNEFLAAASRQQQQNSGQLLILGMILPGMLLLIGWVAREILITLNLKTIASINSDTCNSRLTTAITSLSTLKYNLKALELRHENFSCANFSGVDLSGINFSMSNLSNTNFSNANLSSASFSLADISNTNFSNANLSGANFTMVKPSRTSNIVFFDKPNYAHNINTNFSGANLTDAIFLMSDLSNTSFSNANLSGADLSRTILVNANFSGANLSNNPDHDDVVVPKFKTTTLTLDGDKLTRKTNLMIIAIKGAKFDSADLRNANFTNANFRGVNLSGVDLSSVNKSTMTPEQIKIARDWEKAIYRPEFRKKLGLGLR
jgi:uncharacterized protein YjbI with pentapeptide repeats